MDGNLRSRSLAMAPVLAQVVDVADPLGAHRIKVRLLAYAGGDDQASEVWARVAMPVAGSGYGCLFLPDVDDQVLVVHLNGDPREPVVVGALHHPQARPFHEPVEGGQVKRWSITGHQGTRIAVDESGPATVTIETPGGVTIEVSDGGSKVRTTNGSSTVTLDPSGVSIEAAGQVKVQAAQVSVSAGMVQVDAGIARFSGVVQCDTLISTTVVASTYTPGAGNIW